MDGGKDSGQALMDLGMISMSELGGRITVGAWQLAAVPPRDMLWDDLRDDTVFPGLAILQHVAKVLPPSPPEYRLRTFRDTSSCSVSSVDNSTVLRISTPCASSTPPVPAEHRDRS
jgi:hypothetical protein